MYAVVGCSDCGALWVVSGRPDTSGCPRCEKRHSFSKLRKFVTTEDEDHAREVRASMLANRAGHGDAFAELENFTTLEDFVEDAGMSNDEFMQRSGVDADEARAAGERAEQTTRSLGKRAAVEAALEELDRPTEDEVKAFAAEHDVSGEYVERALSKFERAGDVTKSDGRYRRL